MGRLKKARKGASVPTASPSKNTAKIRPPNPEGLAKARANVSARAVAWVSTDIDEWLEKVTGRKIDRGPVSLQRLPTVIERTGWKERKIYQGMAEGIFPRPVPIDAATVANVVGSGH
jgi:predicted DNA-binding transcriptional regulator AlpA